MIGYFFRALLGRRRFDVEVTLPDDRQMVVRNLPERHLDTFVNTAVDKGRSVRILKRY